MLTEATKLISEKPATYDLTSSDAEVWAEAGGHSYGENAEFPSLVGARWLEVLSKPGVVAAAGLDKDEWSALLQKLTEFEAKLSKADLSLEVLEELTELINKLREEAPEAEDDSDDDDDDDDDE
ncbi:Cholinephosphotransferase 1 [Pleodorina starrii]|uniref:Cholinephosphotransferase 1 n=1 Tax=Pleodorina starrii TaxID=330485 RepID=A0A9W6BGZ6_9CHLO|nr:Cholinephosphotransferase 1 [Pleodorina starrii]GLC51412.1 Cholinephosphotransferase 1 [Pleodorina starrii]